MQHLTELLMVKGAVESSSSPGAQHLCSRSWKGVRGWAESEKIVGFVFYTVFLPVQSQASPRWLPLCSVYLDRLLGPVRTVSFTDFISSRNTERKTRWHRARYRFQFSIVGWPVPFLYPLAELVDCFPEKSIIFKNFYSKLLNKYFINKQKDIDKMPAFWNWWKHRIFKLIWRRKMRMRTDIYRHLLWTQLSDPCCTQIVLFNHSKNLWVSWGCYPHFMCKK